MGLYESVATSCSTQKSTRKTPMSNHTLDNTLLSVTLKSNLRIQPIVIRNYSNVCSKKTQVLFFKK